MNKHLGHFNAPLCGLQITWKPKATYRPNAEGGQTAYHPFTLAGVEAVNTAYLHNVLKDFIAFGAEIHQAEVQDIEANEDLTASFRQYVKRPT